MPQMHFYVPDKVAKQIKRLADDAGLSTSKYIATLVQREIAHSDWPDNFFVEVAGGWQGESLVRPEQGDPDNREMLAAG